MFKHFKKITMVAVLSVSVIAQAGFYSEVDILIREAAEKQFLSFVDPASHYDLFSYVEISQSDKQIAGCDLVFEGIAPLPDRTFSFTACVVAKSKHQITATIIDYQLQN